MIRTPLRVCALLLVLLLVPAVANAADTSFTLTSEYLTAPAYGPGGDTVAWNGSGCNYLVRTWHGRWGKIHSIRACHLRGKNLDVFKSAPKIVRDTTSGRVVVGWAIQFLRRPSFSGIWIATSSDNGRHWNEPKHIVHLGGNQQPGFLPDFQLAASRGLVWAAYEPRNPKTSYVEHLPFNLVAYSEQTGLARSENLTHSKRIYTIDTDPKQFALIAGGGRLFLNWILTDAAGGKHYFSADTASTSARKARLHYNGEFNTTNYHPGKVFVGLDQKVYSVTEEGNEDPTNPAKLIYLERFDFSAHDVKPALADHDPVLTIPVDAMFGPPRMVAAQVSASGDPLVAFVNTAPTYDLSKYGPYDPNEKQCKTEREFAPCMISHVPQAATPLVLLARIAGDGSATIDALRWPFSRVGPDGAQVVQWANTSWGGGMIRPEGSGYRLFSQLLHQDISKTGTLGADGKLALVVSDPLHP